jgi:predicted ATPase
VPPLRLPDLECLPPPEALADFPAVALFIDRARAVKPDFALTGQNAAAAAEICWRVDGLPLAIELAAARTKVFPPQTIVTRLERRLDLLTEGPRDEPARHRSVRACIAWSYSLLDPAEQALFRQIGVFVGGCIADAAEAVADAARDLRMSVMDGLASLVDKSLLQQEAQPDGEARFGMLETLREYALEQLAIAGELDWARHRHAAYFLKMAEEALPELRGPAQGEWLKRLDLEHDNLRATLDWYREAEGGAEDALRLANRKFYRRFSRMEGLADEQNLDLQALPLGQQDALWDQAKSEGL